MLTYTTVRGLVVHINPRYVVSILERDSAWASLNFTCDVWCTVSTTDGDHWDIAERGAAVSLAVWKAMP